MLKVANLHQKPRKNRSQRKLELNTRENILKTEPKITPQTQCHFFLPDRPKNCTGMALCDIVTFQTVKQNLQHSRFFFGNKKLVSNLAKQQIFSRNVSNVKQLIGSMGDMDRISVFFLFTSTTSTFTNKYDRLWPRKIYCILMGKRRQMPMFNSPKVATRHYSILNLCFSGWRFPCEFAHSAHFNSSAKR